MEHMRSRNDLDGHVSHQQVEFIEFCTENKILPLCLSPHSTYMLQPLNLVIFGQLKSKYSNAVDDYASGGVQGKTNSDLIDIIGKIPPEVFNEDFARVAFQAAGLSPLSQQVVLDRCKSSTRAASPEPKEPSQPSSLTSPNNIDLAMDIDEKSSDSLSPEERLEAMKVQVSA
ncbi:hypothetical protein K3495_g2536 [Podosphaera aphanis]|nr:hypothetical protein K3495_g2536 [Podosphaera aphanis]